MLGLRFRLAAAARLRAGTKDEIVVCARTDVDPARDRLGPPVPDAPTAAEELKRKMHLKIGPGDVQAAAGAGTGGSAWIGVALTLNF